MDFLSKLKALFSGGEAPPAPPEVNPDRPWDSEMFQQEAQPMPQEATAPPMEPQDDIGKQVAALTRQREIAKRLVPERAWNR